MKTIAESLCEYAHGLSYSALSPEAVQKTKELLLDTLGVAIGGYDGPPVRAALNVIGELGGAPEATVIGSGMKTSCVNAAFANCAMVRYLDYMDFYFDRDMCHPSENIPVALAVGEKVGASGKDVLTAAYLGFEVMGRLSDTYPFTENGWHHTTMGGYVTPVVAGKLLGLTDEQLTWGMGLSGCTGHTALFFEPGVQSAQIKAVAYGIAAQRGIQAAMLARQNLTGPGRCLEIMDRVLGFKADVSPMEGRERPRVLDVCLKPYASEFMSHPAIDAMLAIVRAHRPSERDIETIELHTYQTAMDIIAEPHHWSPETRETADHSMPYCLAAAFFEGAVGPEQFAHAQWERPEYKRLMGKIHAVHDPELDALYPASRPMNLRVIMKDGTVFSARVDHSKGEPANPMSEEEILQKFKGMVSGRMSDGQMDQLIDRTMHLEKLKDIGELTELFAFR